MSDTNLKDQHLLQQLRRGGRGEDRAVSKLFKLYHGEGVGYLQQKKKLGKAVAEQLFNDALFQFVIAVREGRFEERSSVKTYLFAILNRLCLKHWQYSKKEGVEFTDDLEAEPMELVDESRLTNLMQGTLSLISDSCRRLLRFWALDSYSMSELAEMMAFKGAQIAMNKKSRCLASLIKKIDGNPELRNELRAFL